MLENLVMLAFVAVLMFSVAFGVPTVAALIAGYVIFILYGMKKGYSVPSLLKMSWSGLGTVIRILFIFLLIGILTALWRGAGTIPEIIAVSAGLIHPSGFLLLSFLLNCAVSVLTAHPLHGGHHGRGLYDHGIGHGRESSVYRRGGGIGDLFRGPVLPGVHQRSSGQ